MLRTLKDLFDALAPAPAGEPAERAEHQLQLATAVLLVEVLRLEPELQSGAARDAVDAALRDKFALAPDELERLVELAHDASRNATDYYAFTSRLNDGFDLSQKVRMVEHLWRVAYADGRLSAHENHLMRKLGDLLYIPHGDYVAAKARARDAAAPDR